MQEIREITDPHIINAIVALTLAMLGVGMLSLVVNWNAWVEAERKRKRRRDYGK